MAMRFLRRVHVSTSDSPASPGHDASPDSSMSSFGKNQKPNPTSTSSTPPPSAPALKVRLRRPSLLRRSKSTECEGRNAAQEELPGCMICLDRMTPADLAHPLMCSSSACCYNFCCNCIESLIERKQTKKLHPGRQEEADDTEELKSGDRRHAGEDIILHCPNCRSDLGPTICDTILLRKVDQASSTIEDDSDEEIGRKLALKKAMGVDVTLLREIAQARDREAQFWKKKCAIQSRSSGSSSSEIRGRRMSITNAPPEKCEEDSDEWGFEVDIRVGAHESIKLPNELFSFPAYQSNEIKADRTLLCGLESAIVREDQEQLTRYLISGDTAELATAARILATVAESVHLQRPSGSGDGTTTSPTAVGAVAGAASARSPSPHQMARRTSVYSWIEVGKKARSHNAASSMMSREQQVATKSATPHHVYHTSFYAAKAAKHRQIERRLREKLAYMRHHPLPVRMPKYAEFTIQLDGSPTQLETSQIVKSLPFRFCNDAWDGTVNDAFSKIYVSPKSGMNQTLKGKNYAPKLPTSTFVDNYKVSHKRQETEGIRNILDGGRGKNSQHRGDVRIDTSHPRVLIAAVVDSDASLQGVLKGDVVTHLNGVELRDNTVDDVIALICSLFFSSSSSTPVEDGRSDGLSKDDDGGPQNGGAESVSVVTTVTLKFVFNADRATAEALKMRAVAPNY